MDIATLFYSFKKVDLELFHYNTGTVDFKSNVPSVSSAIFPMKGIELPLQINKEYLRAGKDGGSRDNKYDKTFIIKVHKTFGANIKSDLFINLVDKSNDTRSRFNVKDRIDLGTQGNYNYCMFVCVAMSGEKVR